MMTTVWSLLSVYTDIGVRPRKDLEEKGNKASTTDGYWIVKKGDLVVNKTFGMDGSRLGTLNIMASTSPRVRHTACQEQEHKPQILPLFISTKINSR